MKKDAWKSCPEEDDFLTAFLSEPAGPARKSLFQHAAICSRCYLKFLLLSQLEAQIIAKGENIQDTGLSREERNQLEKMARQKLSELRSKQARPFLRLSPCLAILLGISLTSLILIYLFIGRKLSAPVVWREAFHHEFRLIQPQGSLKKAPDVFSWKEVKGREEFVFQLLDDELTLVYRTITFAPRVQIPEAVKLRLTKGKTYLWTVEAKDRNSHTLATEYLVFKIEE